MDIPVIILYVTLCICSITYVYVKWCFSYWQRKGVQTLKPHILFGNAKSLVLFKDNIGLSISKVTEHFKRKGLRFCGYYIFTHPIFVPVDVELIKKILISDFGHFTDHSCSIHESDPLSCHIFAAKGSKWKTLRSKLAPAFTKSKNKMMFSTVEIPIKTLTTIIDEHCRNNTEINITDLSGRAALDVLASCCFGLEVNSLREKKSDFLHYIKEFYLNPSVKDTLIRICMLIFPKLLEMFKIKSIRSDITDFFLTTSEETVKHREANNIIRNDLMHLMIQIKNNMKIRDDEVGTLKNITDRTTSLSLTEIAAQSFAFFGASHESSSSTVSFCLYEMCLNQYIQEKAQKEVIEVVREQNGNINYETLSKLPYLEKCMKETMRKYPILPFLLRTCTKRYQVPDSDVVLEKDTTCLISVLSLHHDPEVYPNPEQFDPERFSEENIAKRHSLSWIPFGEGPRICIAYSFGIMQIMLTLAMLLMNFRFSLNEKTKVPLVMNTRTLVTSPIDDIRLNVQKVNP